MSFREVPTDTLFAKRRLIEALTRRLFNHQASGPWADVVRGAIEHYRLEAGEPAGVRLGGGGDAV
jgi:hypothetical protein